MTKSFRQYNTAVETREIIARIARSVLQQDRPRFQYATVATIDRVTRTATVLFPSDVTPVKVGMGSVQPMAPGQTVRIEGVRGDRFIADVMGPVGPDIYDIQFKLASPSLHQVWDNGTINWVGNFTAYGMRGANFLTTGVINIAQPANGAVITGVGGASNQTVAGAVINMAVGDGLYYVPPWGTNGASVDANFRMVGSSASYNLPSDWILICTRVNSYLYKWGTGEYDSEFYGTRMTTDVTNATGIGTGYTNGGTEVGVTMRWPNSGRGMILLGAKLRHATAGEGVYAAYQIRDNDSSGTVQVATADTDALYSESGNFFQTSYFNHHGSATLIPGNKYYIRSMVRATASAANATVSARRIGFIPTD